MGSVTGDYPALRFDDPGLLRPFSGRFQRNGELAMTDGFYLQLSFVRLSASEARWCLPQR